MSRRIAAQLHDLSSQQQETTSPERQCSRSLPPGASTSSSDSPQVLSPGRGRGRGRSTAGRGRGRRVRPTPPPPGDEFYPPVVNMFSITSGILRQNCPSIWLEAHKCFAEFCSAPWFGFSLELGTRKEHLHVQGVMKCRYPGNKDAIKQLTTHLKGFLHTVPGDNSRILIKLCHTGQTDQYMLGYIQKDKGQTHFQVCLAAVLLCILLTLLHAIGLPHCLTSLFLLLKAAVYAPRCQ